MIQRKGIIFDQQNPKETEGKKEQPKNAQNQQQGQDQQEEQQKKNPIDEGHTEAIKDEIKEEDKTKKKFENLIKSAGKVLFETSSTFPFDLFPDKITIDLTKVNIVSSEFLSSGRAHSVFIQDISDVFVEFGLFFATLKVVDSGFVENTIDVKYLKKKDALKARRLIQGLVVAKKNGIDLGSLENMSNLIDKIEKLGAINEQSNSQKN